MTMQVLRTDCCGVQMRARAHLVNMLKQTMRETERYAEYNKDVS